MIPLIFWRKRKEEKKKKSRMFEVRGKRLKTWNPVVGCYHQCIYCFARDMAKRQLHRCVKCYNFVPHLHIERLDKVPKSDLPIFVCDMGDLFGYWVKRKWIEIVLEVIELNEDKEFLLLTKNPSRYLEFDFPDNVILGATIETDLDFLYEGLRISLAPLPSKRIKAMIQLSHPKKMVAIEPILKFSSEFHLKIEEINPAFVYVGYCNPKWKAEKLKLPEPSLGETMDLIMKLREFTEVRVKTLRKNVW